MSVEVVEGQWTLSFDSIEQMKEFLIDKFGLSSHDLADLVVFNQGEDPDDKPSSIIEKLKKAVS